MKRGYAYHQGLTAHPEAEQQTAARTQTIKQARPTATPLIWLRGPALESKRASPDTSEPASAGADYARPILPTLQKHCEGTHQQPALPRWETHRKRPTINAGLAEPLRSPASWLPPSCRLATIDRRLPAPLRHDLMCRSARRSHAPSHRHRPE